MKSLLLSFAAMFITLIALGWAAGRSVFETINREAWLRHTGTVLHVADQFQLIFEDINIDTKTYLQGGQNSLLARCRAEVSGLLGVLVDLRYLTHDNPSQQERITRLMSVFTQVAKQVDALESESNINKKGLSKVILPIRSSDLIMTESAIEQTQILIKEFVIEEERLLVVRTASIDTANRTTILIIHVMSDVSLFVIMGAFIMVLHLFKMKRIALQRVVESNAGLETEVASRTSQLQIQAHDLLMVNAELQHFAKIASHDLQEPLRAISTMTEKVLYAEAEKFSVESRKDMDLVIEGTQRMRQVILDLLSYSNVQRHGDAFVEISVENVLAKVLLDIKPSIEKGSVTISKSVMPNLFSDMHLMELLLGNLIGNAIKFRGSTTTIISIESRRASNGWEIDIVDNGIGIAARHHQKIFELFKRLHGNGFYPGTGLGLALCKRIVEMHGGRIWVDSQLGIGAKFSFSIPDRALV